MRSRLIIAAVAVAAAAALFVVLRPESDDAPAPDPTTTRAAPPTLDAPPTTTRQRPNVVRATIEAGDELHRLTVAKNRRFILVIRASVSDHVHIHGYDLMQDVTPAKPARFDFRTSIDGRFEIELEDSGKEIAQLTVTP